MSIKNREVIAMKKLFMILCMAGLISANPLAAFATNGMVPETAEITTLGNNDYIDAIIIVMEELGFETEEVKLFQEHLQKSCKLTIKGTLDGKEVEVVITIEGMTCAEVIKALTEK